MLVRREVSASVAYTHVGPNCRAATSRRRGIAWPGLRGRSFGATTQFGCTRGFAGATVDGTLGLPNAQLIFFTGTGQRCFLQSPGGPASGFGARLFV